MKRQIDKVADAGQWLANYILNHPMANEGTEAWRIIQNAAAALATMPRMSENDPLVKYVDND